MATTRLSVRVQTKLRREVRGLAYVKGKRESEIVREALEEYVEAAGGRATCLDLARKAGLVGVVEGAPHDLSTNRMHLRGLGRK